MGLCEREKSPSPLHGAPRWNAPTPGSLTPCGVRSPGATRPSSLRDSDLAMQTRFRDTYKERAMPPHSERDPRSNTIFQSISLLRTCCDRHEIEVNTANLDLVAAFRHPDAGAIRVHRLAPFELFDSLLKLSNCLGLIRQRLDLSLSSDVTDQSESEKAEKNCDQLLHGVALPYSLNDWRGFFLESRPQNLTDTTCETPGSSIVTP